MKKANEIIDNLTIQHFKHDPLADQSLNCVPYSMDRKAYADTYGPTVGDRLRLGNTNLWLEIEKDYTVYGDECKFGGGKVLREGMGQATSISSDDALDLVITNAVIVDHTGIIKVIYRYNILKQIFCFKKKKDLYFSSFFLG